MVTLMYVPLFIVQACIQLRQGSFQSSPPAEADFLFLPLPPDFLYFRLYARRIDDTCRNSYQALPAVVCIRLRQVLKIGSTCS